MYSRRKSKAPVIITVVLVIIVLAATVFIAWKMGGGVLGQSKKNYADNASVSDKKSKTTEEVTEEEVVPVSTVTIGSAGDILIHKPLLQGANSGGTYDFNDIFTYVKGTIEKCDYFIANLEVTLGGADRGYSSYPTFNTPDAIVDAAKNAGIDCLLTANNHCYDTSEDGLIRTLGILNEKKIDHTGTRLSETDSKYFVKEINGVKFGFICYTYETESQSGKSINGIPTSAAAAPLINSFNYSNLDAFYTEFKAQYDEMKKDGAEFIIAYPHWGDEYQLSPNSWQKQMAQKMCDIGVDVIIGGHPHVVQPVELITSTTDSKHKTACLYSMGNFVSNQRRQYMSIKDGHTEDGVIFEMSFTKYSDGTVSFDKVRSIPTWVHLYGSKPVYAITPLSSKLSEKASELGLNNSSSGLSMAQGSYDRTMALVKEGTSTVNKWLKSGASVSGAADEATSAETVSGETASAPGNASDNAATAADTASTEAAATAGSASTEATSSDSAVDNGEINNVDDPDDDFVDNGSAASFSVTSAGGTDQESDEEN